MGFINFDPFTFIVTLAGVVGPLVGRKLYKKRTGVRKEAQERRTLNELDIPLVEVHVSGAIMSCNEAMARLLQARSEDIQRLNVDALMGLLAERLVEEGFAVSAKEDWGNLFKKTVQSEAGGVLQTPPLPMSVEMGKIRSCSLLMKLTSQGGTQTVLVAINKLRHRFSIKSNPYDEKQWHMEVTTRYRDLATGQWFDFAPHTSHLQKLFAILNDAGNYAHIGSSAMRFYANELKRISAIDIVVPADELDAFMERITSKLEDAKWVREDIHKREDHPRAGCRARFSLMAKVSLELNVFEKVGKWRFSNTAKGNLRDVTRGDLTTTHLSLEDALFLYHRVDDKKMKYTYHSRALREFIRAIWMEKSELRFDAFEQVIEDSGVGGEHEERARGLFVQLTEAWKDFSADLDEVEILNFDKRWEKYARRKGNISRFWQDK